MTLVCPVCLSWAAGKHKDFNYNFQAGNFPPLSLNRRQHDITRKYHRSLIFCVWTGTDNPLEYIIPRLRLCIIHHLLCSVSKLSPQCWSVNTVKTLLLPASSEAPKGSAPCLVPRGTSNAWNIYRINHCTANSCSHFSLFHSASDERLFLVTVQFVIDAVQ